MFNFLPVRRMIWVSRSLLPKVMDWFVNVWVTGGPSQRGVSWPDNAIVWHAGKPWVYRDNGDGSYTRLAVDPQPGPGPALPIGKGLTPATKVVVTGAQTLLSEEFRGTIPSEDESR